MPVRSLRLREPGFEGLAHIIVSQMVSRASVDLAQAAARRCRADGRGLCRSSPRAAWREVGLSRAKAETLDTDRGGGFSGGLDLQGAFRPAPTEALAALTALKGVGPWTAEVYLMFCGGHADVFPSGDVLQNAVAAAFGLDQRPTTRALALIAAEWAPEIGGRAAFLGVLCSGTGTWLKFRRLNRNTYKCHCVV